jgi:hypothetical protein
MEGSQEISCQHKATQPIEEFSPFGCSCTSNAGCIRIQLRTVLCGSGTDQAPSRCIPAAGFSDRDDSLAHAPQKRFQILKTLETIVGQCVHQLWVSFFMLYNNYL